MLTDFNRFFTLLCETLRLCVFVVQFYFVKLCSFGSLWFKLFAHRLGRFLQILIYSFVKLCAFASLWFKFYFVKLCSFASLWFKLFAHRLGRFLQIFIYSFVKLCAFASLWFNSTLWNFAALSLCGSNNICSQILRIYLLLCETLRLCIFVVQIRLRC